MLEAAFWGFVGGFALLVGAVIGLRVGASQRVIGLVMAFGSGVLISALAFELTAEAFRRGGADAVAAGLAAGGAEPGQAQDFGFMYQRGLTDPDGNVVDFGWMDPVAAEQGPEAFTQQQA